MRRNNNTHLFPPQFFWKIETLWEKYFTHISSDILKFTDFSELRKKYISRKIKQGGLPPCSSSEFLFLDSPNFTHSENSVFEDEKEENFLGLQQFTVCFQDNTKPVYFFDNHHQALFPFWEVFEEQKKSLDSAREPEISGLTIVHIDAHRDDAIFPFPVGTSHGCCLQEEDIQKIISQCRVSDYLDAGKKIGLISEIISVTQESEFENFLDLGLEKLISEKTPYILNLDIDIYGPEGTAVETVLKTEVIAKAWKNADAVCFATSPGFIDSGLAKKLGEIMY